MSDHEDEERYRTEYDAPKAVWGSCYTCRDYTEYRKHTLAPLLADKARRDGRDVTEVVDEFMLAAHARHLRGEPLRPDGPTRVTDPNIGRLTALFASGLPEGTWN